MNEFHRAWLSLREPIDAASRADGLVEALKRVHADGPIHVTDLATGTGANFRYLSQALGGRQEWCMIDHDPALLDAIPGLTSEWAGRQGANLSRSGRELTIAGRGFECRIRWERTDLANDLAGLDLSGCSLVSASAFLDLVSESWLESLARRCSSIRAPVLFALTYDGRIRFEPREAGDERVRQLVNRHQLTDKGFGPALGSMAGPRALQIFEALGYHVEWAHSDWRLTPTDRALQEALLEGWLTAAVEIEPESSTVLRPWMERRLEHVARGRSAISVGHLDMLGWIPD